MSENKQPDLAPSDGEEKPSDGTPRDSGKRSNGDGPTGERIDLATLLDEISARLVMAGSIPLGQTQTQTVPEKPAEQMKIIIFVMGDIRYAVEMNHIDEVTRNPDITPVPGLPDWVLGVTNLHGDIISVVSLAHFLDVELPAHRKNVSMVVAHAADQRIGLVVDDTEVIYTFPTEQVISPPFKVSSNLVSYLQGAVERQGEFIRLLDCEYLLLSPQMQQFS
jgi:purine-binding chemotaxis protein CheW